MPKLELWKSSNKGSKLLVLFGGETRFAVFEAFVLGEGGIEFWLEKCQKEIKEIDAETVGYYVPALGEDYAEEEED